MKTKLFIIVLFISVITYSQVKYLPSTEKELVFFAYQELQLVNKYIDYCRTDSAIVGMRYITEERKRINDPLLSDSLDGYMSYTKFTDIYYNKNHPKYNYDKTDVAKMDVLWGELIKEQRKPTFEGYAKWLTEYIEERMNKYEY